MELPQRANARTDTDEPRDAVSSAEIVEPNLVKLLTENELPAETKATVDSLYREPTRVTPCTLRPEPILANARTEIDDPIAPIAMTVKLLPRRECALKLHDDPKWMKLSTETRACK
jgi:hypothetical protein